MDNETPVAPKRRGRKPKSQSAVDTSSLKQIQLDEDLKNLINRRNGPSDLEPLRVKLPKAVKDEIQVNVDSLNHSGNTKMDVNAYVTYALELANENLADVLRRHLAR